MVASVNCTGRDPKMFLVSSSTYTSTLTTSSLCYTSNTGTALTACSGKRKRQILEDPLNDLQTDLLLPSIRASRDFDLSAGINGATKAGQREGKFLLYWMTTTSSTTTTTYTATATLATLECTPTSWTMAVCG